MIDRLNRRLWAPKLRPERLWRLYQNDATQQVDDSLVDDVGLSLYLRCESVLLVSSGKIKCPECQTVFATNWVGQRPELPVVCPTCAWSTTGGQYHQSWRHQDLIGVNAAPAFQAFVAAYPTAATSRAKTLLIDQLIHSFHYGLQSQAPNRSAANNLIEGSHDQVLALLDRLSANPSATTGTTTDYPSWRQEVEAMRKRRAGN